MRLRSKVLRKTIYLFDDQFKEHMSKKNDTIELEKELDYCKGLEKRIEKEQSLSFIPAVKEKLNLLKETVEDTHKRNYFIKRYRC